jgi:hypothetical protein
MDCTSNNESEKEFDRTRYASEQFVTACDRKIVGGREGGQEGVQGWV